MKPIKLSPIKRMMMFVLSLLVHNVYHTDAFGWTLVVSSTTATCSTQCRSYGGYGIYVNSMSQWHIEFPAALASYYSRYASSCLCLTYAEYNYMNSCNSNRARCGNGTTSYMTSTTYRTHVLLTAGGTYNSMWCNSGYGECTCISGTYASNQGCYVCPGGYYCTGGAKVYSLGLTGSRGTTSCPSPGTSSGGLTMTNATNCYVPAGTTGTDTKGAYKYLYACYYGS